MPKVFSNTVRIGKHALISTVASVALTAYTVNWPHRACDLNVSCDCHRLFFSRASCQQEGAEQAERSEASEAPLSSFCLFFERAVVVWRLHSFRLALAQRCSGCRFGAPRTIRGRPKAAKELSSGTKSGPRAAERAPRAAQDRVMSGQPGGVRVTPPYAANTQIHWKSLDGRRSRQGPCFNYTIV